MKADKYLHCLFSLPSLHTALEQLYHHTSHLSEVPGWAAETIYRKKQARRHMQQHGSIWYQTLQVHIIHKYIQMQSLWMWRVCTCLCVGGWVCTHVSKLPYVQYSCSVHGNSHQKSGWHRHRIWAIHVARKEVDSRMFRPQRSSISWSKHPTIFLSSSFLAMWIAQIHQRQSAAVYSMSLYHINGWHAPCSHIKSPWRPPIGNILQKPFSLHTPHVTVMWAVCYITHLPTGR